MTFQPEITQEDIHDSTLRVIKNRKLVDGKGALGYIKTWSRQTKFWAIRPSLFESVAGFPLSKVFDHIAQTPAPGLVIGDNEWAEKKALSQKLSALKNKVSMEETVFENWNLWQFYPRIVMEVFGVDTNDIEKVVTQYDKEISPKVIANEGTVLKSQQQEEREEAKRVKEAEELERQVAVLKTSIPDISRMTHAAFVDDFGYQAFKHSRCLMLEFQLSEQDNHGSDELMAPILDGFWKLFFDYSKPGGIEAYPMDRKFTVYVPEDKLVALHRDAQAISAEIEAILSLESRKVGVLSASRAAKVLKVTRPVFDQLRSIGEIFPARQVEIQNGRLRGTIFNGYSPRDILKMRDNIG